MEGTIAHYGTSKKFGLKEKRHKEGPKLSERGTILIAKKIRGNPNPNLGTKR